MSYAKRLLAFVIMLAVLVTSVPMQGFGSMTAYAAETTKLTVTGDIVNIRKGAGTSHAKVTTVKRSTVLTSLGTAKDPSGTVWYKVNVNGSTGYIISTYVKVTNVTAATTTTTTTKTTAATKTTTTASGTLAITVPGSSGTTTASTTAKTTSGTTGTTIAPNIALMITAGPVEVRSGAGDSYSLMKTINNGQEIVILSNRTDSSGDLWYRIRFGSFSGYVRASVLNAATVTTAATTTTTTKSTSAATTSTKLPPRGTTTTTDLFIPPSVAGTSTTKSTATQSTVTQPNMIITTNDISEMITTNPNDTASRVVKYGTVKCDTKLNVRAGASTTSAVLGTLNNGRQVIITETKGDWYKIEYNSGYGYVMSQYVTNVKTGTISVLLDFSRDYYYVNQGSTVNISIDLPGYTVSYTSEDSSGASVSDKGVVTGKKPGLYTITAKTGSASTTTEVVVLKAKSVTVAPMTISEAGTKFIADWEGGGTPFGDAIVFYPYQDVSGYWTVGYGHAVTSSESKKWTREQATAHFNTEITALLGEGHEITEEKPYLTAEEASALLNADLNSGPYVKAVSDWAVRNGVVLTQNQFDALVSFCYNLGPAHWTSDTYYFYLKSAIIAHRDGSAANPDQVIEGFTRYIKSGGVNLKGLWWRRRNEAEMFVNGDYAIDRDNKFKLPNITWG